MDLRKKERSFLLGVFVFDCSRGLNTCRLSQITAKKMWVLFALCFLSLSLLSQDRKVVEEFSYKKGYWVHKSFLNDTLDGPYYEYSDINGSIEYVVRSFYKKGKLDGTYYRYYSGGTSGRLLEQRNYADGVLNGPVIYYDERGRPFNRSFYKYGVPHGEWQTLDKKGRILTYAHFYLGKCSVIFHLDRKGRLIGREFLDGNNIKVKKELYDKNGLLYETIRY